MTVKEELNSFVTSKYAPLSDNGLLSCFDLRKVVDDKIKEFSSKKAGINKRIPNSGENSVLINTFILEILELVKILQPISREDLIEIYKAVKGFEFFKFVKKDGNLFHNEIKFDYIIKLLQTVGLIEINDAFISSKLLDNSQQLMFTYNKKAENQERNRLICRKYRYRGI